MIDDDQIENPSILSEIVGAVAVPAFIERNLLKAFGLLSSSVIGAITGTINRREAEKWSDTMARIKISETVATQIIENLDVPSRLSEGCRQHICGTDSPATS